MRVAGKGYFVWLKEACCIAITSIPQRKFRLLHSGKNGTDDRMSGSAKINTNNHYH